DERFAGVTLTQEPRRGSRRQRRRPNTTARALVAVILAVVAFTVAGMTAFTQVMKSKGTTSSSLARDATPSAAATGANAVTDAPIRVTAAELARWQAQTSTSAQKAQMLHKVQSAFAGVAEVGVGDQTG